MKMLIALITVITTLNVFAFDESTVDHLDIIDLADVNKTELLFTVNYPGLNNFRTGSNLGDCFVLHTPKNKVTIDQLEEFKKSIFLADGDGILFPNSPLREINPLEGEIISNFRKTLRIKFPLKDLQKYVTGVRIATYSPYINIRQVMDATFGEQAPKVFFQFVRGCRL